MINLSTQKFVSWADPIEMLYACHDKVKSFCKQLTILPNYLQVNGCNQVVKNDVKQILNYFNLSAPLHHDDEEKDFFPCLLEYEPQVQTEINKLQQEHDELHKIWLKLSQELDELISDQRILISSELIHQFVESYAKHIYIEEPLFELGKKYLSKEQQKIMGQKMAQRRHL